MKLLNGIILQAFLAGLTLLSCFAVGELGIRLFQFVRHGTPLYVYGDGQFHESPFVAFDPKMGWKTPANQRQILTAKDLGVDHTVHYSTGPYGFRLYGDVKSSNPKIMIVGDSFTHALKVSDDETYYANLKKTLSDRVSVEIFAYGAGGYGTLQEDLIVERYIKEIMPDILILQVCGNDFINNSFELESESFLNNNHMVRPYLGLDGTITMQMPQPRFRKMALWAASYSRFLDWVITRFDNWIAVNKLAHTVEEDIDHQGAVHPGFRRAATLTDQLFQRLRSAVGAATKIYAFESEDSQPYSAEFQKIFARHGIIYIEGVGEAVSDAFHKGEVVYAIDGSHWSSTGHAVVARILADGLRFTLTATQSEMHKSAR